MISDGVELEPSNLLNGIVQFIHFTCIAIKSNPQDVILMINTDKIKTTEFLYKIC